MNIVVNVFRESDQLFLRRSKVGVDRRERELFVKESAHCISVSRPTSSEYRLLLQASANSSVLRFLFLTVYFSCHVVDSMIRWELKNKIIERERLINVRIIVAFLKSLLYVRLKPPYQKKSMI